MKITLKKLTENDIDAASRFIAHQNAKKEHNITDLAEEAHLVAHQFRNELPDVPAEESFVLAYEKEKLVGVFGFDADLGRKKAYLWGPFVEHADWQSVATELWQELQGLMPADLEECLINLNLKNTRGLQFGEKVGFSVRKDATMMKLRKENFSAPQVKGIRELDGNNHPDFVKLHDTIFPETYFNGKELIERDNENRKVFVTDDLSGYVYAEIYPGADYGDIHFLGVLEEKRGQGLGTQLLNVALGWMFSLPHIKTVGLTTNEEDFAYQLYQRAGFEVDNQVRSMVKKSANQATVPA